MKIPILKVKIFIDDTKHQILKAGAEILANISVFCPKSALKCKMMEFFLKKKLLSFLLRYNDFRGFLWQNCNILSIKNFSVKNSASCQNRAVSKFTFKSSYTQIYV